MYFKSVLNNAKEKIACNPQKTSPKVPVTTKILPVWFASSERNVNV